jgi:hypothetical protein
MRVMAKFAPLVVLLFCAWAAAQAADKIPISAVPRRVRAAIEDFVPGAQLIEVKVSDDRVYKRVFNCTYFRNIHLGTIKLTYKGALLDIDEALVIDDVPPKVREVIHRETKGGLIKRIRLDALYGHLVYRVKAYYSKSTNIEISLTISRSGHIVERKVSQGLLIF